MQLFYFKDYDPHKLPYRIEKEESRHIIKSLRKQSGDTILFTDGRGGLYEGVLAVRSQQRAEIESAFAKANNNTPHPYHLHIAIAPTKSNDRYEWFLEKATEMGVNQITPIRCDHSERKKIRLDRYQKIIASAMKQSNQLFMPQLNELTDLSEFLSYSNGSCKLIAHCENGRENGLIEAIMGQKNITLLIGPEGDFSSEEIQMALDNDFKPVRLGANRLRTETAGVYAAAVLNAQHDRTTDK